MPLSLSVFLPVRDVQASITADVRALLDVLADATPRMDLLVVDDGSTDATSEAVHELCLEYPQVRQVRHPLPLGALQAWRTALARLRGDVVMCLLVERRVSPEDLPALWWAAAEHEIVVGAAPGVRAESNLALPFDGGREQCQPPVQLMRRRLLHGWCSARGGQLPLEYLIRRGLAIYSLPLRMAAADAAGQRADRRNSLRGDHRASDLHPARDDASPMPRPNFLDRIRELAWGE